MRYILFFAALASFAAILIRRNQVHPFSQENTSKPPPLADTGWDQLIGPYSYYAEYAKFSQEDSVSELALWRTGRLTGKRLLRSGPSEIWAYYKFLIKGDTVRFFVSGRRGSMGRTADSSRFGRFLADGGDWINGDLHVCGHQGVVYTWGDPAITDDSNKRTGYPGGFSIICDDPPQGKQ